MVQVAHRIKSLTLFFGVNCSLGISLLCYISVRGRSSHVLNACSEEFPKKTAM